MNGRNAVARAALLLAGGVLLVATAACRREGAQQPAAPPDVPTPPGDPLSPPPPANVAAPLRYHCDGLDFSARFDNDRVTLRAPGREYVLPQVAAASGAKFESGEAMFWNKGREALLEIGGKRYANCREAGAG
ncbi:MliC family protein [Solimonas soli]|uniref:MliC family protein n=1 Tax=Solimonas soli TaxID=413479 RepID=UPI0004B2DF3C|nr:MliC family protein [Solimonas soli]